MSQVAGATSPFSALVDDLGTEDRSDRAVGAVAEIEPRIAIGTDHG